MQAVAAQPLAGDRGVVGPHRARVVGDRVEAGHVRRERAQPPAAAERLAAEVGGDVGRLRRRSGRRTRAGAPCSTRPRARVASARRARSRRVRASPSSPGTQNRSPDGVPDRARPRRGGPPRPASSPSHRRGSGRARRARGRRTPGPRPSRSAPPRGSRPGTGRRSRSPSTTGCCSERVAERRVLEQAVPVGIPRAPDPLERPPSRPAATAPRMPCRGPSGAPRRAS